MPYLNANNLPPSPAAKLVTAICRVFERAKGLKDSKLNQSSKIGLDAILKDAAGEKLQEAQMPCTRLTYETAGFRLVSNAGAAISQLVNVNVYFFYAVGKPAVGVLPVEFTDLRERHIRWNIEHLKNQRVRSDDTTGITDAERKDDSGQIYWWWPDGEQEVEITHNVQFDLAGLGIPVELQQGFSCSKASFVVAVNNHATFNN